MKMTWVAFSGALFVCASAASAQGVAPAVASIASTSVTGDTTHAVLRTGTKVPLKLSEELTTKGKKLRVGQRFQLEVAESVLVDNQVVMPIGSPAIGEVTEVRNKGMWGKSGHFTAQVLYATVNGRQVKLNGTFDDKGTAGGIGAVAVSAVVFAPAGFFMTGTSARVPLGAPVTAFVGEDVPIELAASPAPLVVTPQAAVVPAEQPKVIPAISGK